MARRKAYGGKGKMGYWIEKPSRLTATPVGTRSHLLRTKMRCL
jgi:hypothetical protein